MALKKSQLYSSLWNSCDELRGGMDASQYKDFPLSDMPQGGSPKQNAINKPQRSFCSPVLAMLHDRRQQMGIVTAGRFIHDGFDLLGSPVLPSRLPLKCPQQIECVAFQTDQIEGEFFGGHVHTACPWNTAVNLTPSNQSPSPDQTPPRSSPRPPKGCNRLSLSNRLIQTIFTPALTCTECPGYQFATLNHHQTIF